MKKILLGVLMIALFAACGKKNVELTVEEFQKQAPELVDQTVTVKGIAKHICQRSGKKLFLASESNAENAITVFAGENMETFDRNALEKNCTVTGVVKIMTVIDENYLKNWEEQVMQQIAAGTADEHHCSTESKVLDNAAKCEENGETAEIDSTLLADNPQLKQIAEFREKIAAQGGTPVTIYSIECSSYTVEEK